MSLVDKRCIKKVKISGRDNSHLTMTPQQYRTVMRGLAECRGLKKVWMELVILDGDVTG